MTSGFRPSPPHRSRACRFAPWALAVVALAYPAPHLATVTFAGPAPATGSEEQSEESGSEVQVRETSQKVRRVRLLPPHTSAPLRLKLVAAERTRSGLGDAQVVNLDAPHQCGAGIDRRC